MKHGLFLFFFQTKNVLYFPFENFTSAQWQSLSFYLDRLSFRIFLNGRAFVFVSLSYKQVRLIPHLKMFETKNKFKPENKQWEFFVVPLR